MATFPDVDTREASAVSARIREHLLSINPDGDLSLSDQTYDLIGEMFRGNVGDFRAIDLQYHDYQHTLQGFVYGGTPRRPTSSQRDPALHIATMHIEHGGGPDARLRVSQNRRRRRWHECEIYLHSCHPQCGNRRVAPAAIRPERRRDRCRGQCHQVKY